VGGSQSHCGVPHTNDTRRCAAGSGSASGRKKQFSGLGLQELPSSDLRHENAKLKQVVADLTLDRHILQEICRKKISAHAAKPDKT
jgi:putative transposase